MPPDFKYYLISFLIAFLVLGLFIILLTTLYSKKQQKYKHEKLKMQLDFQQALLETQLEIQEQTFKKISQEIHDNIGQALTLAKLNINTMPAVTEAQQEKISTTKQIISKSISDLRDLSRSLNTDYIADMGLQKAIEYELVLISKSSNIQTNLRTEGKTYRADKQKELILFRIVQEVLNNALKHAEAKNINAVIKYDAGELIVNVNDDGKGFDPGRQGFQNGASLGLRNMNNRARLIGAVFFLKSLPGKGTQVTINLPVKDDDPKPIV